MDDQRAMSEDQAAAVVAIADVPTAPERLQRLADLLPAFRARCTRLYAADVEGFEFDFLRPRE